MREDVHWFVVLADEENVTAAAELLHVPQPTLSRRLARLERRLGADLFDRTGRRVALNAAGRAYAEHVRRADHELAAGEQAIRDLAGGAAPVVHLGFLHSFGSWLVPDLIRRARDADPSVAFELVQGSADAVTGLVRDGSLDLGIVAPRPAAPGLAWRRLMRQGLVLAVPAGHPLAARRSVTLTEVAEEQFVTMPPAFGMRQILDEACATAGFEPRVAVECQELDTVSGLVSAGIGVALLPDERAPRAPGLVALRLDDADATRDVGFVWRRGAALSAAATSLRDLTVRR